MAAVLSISRTSQMRPDSDGTHRLNAQVSVSGNLAATGLVSMQGHAIPAVADPADVGKVLTVGAGPSFAWQTPLGGGGTFTPPVGIGTAGPDRALDVLDAANPQIRVTQTDGSVYTDFQTDATGYLHILPSGVAPLAGRTIIGSTAAPAAILHVFTSAPAAVSSGNGTAGANALQTGGQAGGDSSAATATVSGGNGGGLLLQCGSGGKATAATTTGTGGNGGPVTLAAGGGGTQSLTSGNNTGGNGGANAISSGAGGAANGVTSGTNAGGSGANITLTAGVGGAATNGATNNGGGGGAITITAGAGGAGATLAGTGGNVRLVGGASGGATGTAGSVVLLAGGPAGGTAGSVRIRNSADTQTRLEVGDVGIGFFAHAQVAQQTASGNTATVAAGSTTNVFTNTSFSGGVGATGYTVGDIVAALKNLGLVAA